MEPRRAGPGGRSASITRRTPTHIWITTLETGLPGGDLRQGPPAIFGTRPSLLSQSERLPVQGGALRNVGQLYSVRLDGVAPREFTRRPGEGLPYG